jgi:hypothetical protein
MRLVMRTDVQAVPYWQYGDTSNNDSSILKIPPESLLAADS